jgi:hypothetical protein
MRILRRQVSSLLQVSEQRWASFVSSSLESSYPMSPIFDLDEEAQLVAIADACDRARANGLESDAQTLAFVHLMHEFAPDFDQHPYLRAILDAPGQPIAARWERLFDREDDALERAYREIERDQERPGRSFHIERYERIEEAFPTSHRDPRFARCFREIKARHEARRARLGERQEARPPRREEEGSLPHEREVG